MSEKIIDEVMWLVRMYGDKNYMQGGADANDRELQSNRLESDINEKLQAIRAKLREVLERKPMSEEDAYDLTHSAGPDLVALGQKWLENEIHVYQYAHQAEAIVTKAVRDTERFHGIGS